MNDFDLAELTDDVDDAWSAEEHQPEMAEFIRLFMGLPQQVVLLGGDAHFGTTGIVGPKHAGPDACAKVIYQCVSSAIVNTPPPKVFTVPFALYMEKMMEKIGKQAYARMIPLQKVGEEKKKVLFPKRNYAILQQQEKKMRWELFVEPTKSDRIVNLGRYRLDVPEAKVPSGTPDAQAGSSNAPSQPIQRKRGRLAALKKKVENLFKKIIGKLKEVCIYLTMIKRLSLR
jgi:hypothetical protein